MSAEPYTREKIEYLIEAWNWLENCEKSSYNIPSLLRQLLTENEALRRDAERYRWLRAQSWNQSSLCVVAQPKVAVKLGHDCPSLERLDEVIDAARMQ